MYRTFLACALCITLFSFPSEATNPCLPYLEFSRQFWGAKFFEGYKAFDFSKNPMITGVEVEFAVPRKTILGFEGGRFTTNQARRGLAEIIREAIRREFPGIEVKIIRKDPGLVGREYNYAIQYELDGRTYEYEIQGENSVVPYRYTFGETEPSFVGTELVSPKLYNQQDINLFYTILRHSLMKLP